MSTHGCTSCSFCGRCTICGGCKHVVRDFEAQAREALTPEKAASCHIRIHLCPGKLAQGCEVRCHPDAEPGGYDVLLGMSGLNQIPFADIEEAKAYALYMQHGVALAIRCDRAGKNLEQTGGAQDLVAKRPDDFADYAAELRRRQRRRR